LINQLQRSTYLLNNDVDLLFRLIKQYDGYDIRITANANDIVSLRELVLSIGG